jgi:hypothetical protein
MRLSKLSVCEWKIYKSGSGFRNNDIFNLLSAEQEISDTSTILTKYLSVYPSLSGSGR